MIKLTKCFGLAVLAALFVARPTVAINDVTGSMHFPNDGDGTGAAHNVDNPCIGCGATDDMKCTLVVPGCSGAIKFPVDLTGGDTGATVTANMGAALCAAVVAVPGNTCTAACTPANFGLGATVSCNCNGSGGNDFTITHDVSTGLTVAPVAPTSRINNLNCQTKAGNSVDTDLLERYLIRVDPNSQTGDVVLNVEHTQGGANPRTATIANASTLSDVELHTAISNAFNGMGLGLNATVCPPSAAAGTSGAPETFPGNFVLVTYSPSIQATLTDFEIVGRPGQILTSETAIATTAVPSLNKWGMGLLFATVLLTGLWMIGRRFLNA